MLWDALRTRRRHTDPKRGLDAAAYRWQTRFKHARVGLTKLQREAQEIVALDKYWSTLTDEDLNEKITSLREVFARRNHKPNDIRTAMAAIREVANRESGEKPYMVQIMGALGLFHGQIVEMVTGEGKTLTAAVAATLLGWLRRPVHVITVNDYLAQRDADSRQPIYRRCGLIATSVIGETPEPMRHQAYRQPIVYTTQKELVADWLRDQLRLKRIADPVSTRWLIDANAAKNIGNKQPRPTQILVPGLHIAIVDEADAVLIDEAVTPLIIAQPRGEDAQAQLYQRAREFAQQLEAPEHFNTEQVKRTAKLTPAGRDKITSLLKSDEHGIWRAKRRREELVEQALVAEHCYHNRQHYQIVEDQITIVDEYTGRFMPDRQWQHGLHQAIEAKHNLAITADRDTLASMSFQRFFRQYHHLCGMTGTAADAKPELETTYGLPVRVIPTNRTLQRKQLDDLIFLTAQEKWNAVLEEITQIHKHERPILVGTRSIEASELLSEMLTEAKLEHQVLNATHHKAEAQIVEKAGLRGSIVVATNMAGRGTDIKLAPGVATLGGLHVILTERHTARRIDRQLFGRAGRQGDPGSARCIISLEDDLVLKYTPRLAKILQRYCQRKKIPAPKWASKLHDLAQRRAQNKAFKSRASVMRHDEDLDRTLPQ